MSNTNTTTPKKGEFVRFVGTDQQGEYSHVGQVVKVTKEHVHMQTEGGVMAVEVTASFEKARKPKSFREQTVEVAKEAGVQSVKVRKQRVASGPTKQDAVTELVRANATLSRKELVALVMEQAAMTQAGGSTYVYNACKALGLKFR